MSSDFQFGVEEFEENRTVGKAVWLVIRMFVIAFSSLATAAFFYSYVGDAFAFVFGDLSPYVVAIAGTFALEGLSQCWAYVRSNHATTLTQMQIARTIGWGDMIGSIAVAVTYMLLNSAFDVGIRDGAGSLTALGSWLNIAGVTILIVSIAANFLAANLYLDTSAENRDAVHRTKLAALMSAGRHHVDDARQRMVITNTVSDIQRQLPNLAAQQGAQVSREYLGRQFQGFDHNVEGEISNRQPTQPMVWRDNGVHAFPVERPDKGYVLVTVEGGRVHVQQENLTLREAWRRVDNGMVGEDTFVARAGTFQPVGRDGKPIDISMIVDDDFDDDDDFVPGGNGLEDSPHLGQM